MSNLAKLLTRSSTLVRQGDLVGAQTELEKAARDHRHNAEPWVSLAAVCGMRGNYPEALRCARKAVELAPQSLQAWVNLANAAESCGDLAQAAEAFQRARGLPGCPPEITLNLGFAFAETGRWADAEAALRDFSSRHPGHREAILTLGKTLVKQDKFEDAVAVMGPYCQQHPQDVPALAQLGMVYLQYGRIEEAWHSCNQAAAVAANDPDLLFLKAALLMFEGRYEDARDTYEHLLRMQQTSPDVHLLILAAKACRGAGNPDATVAYARTAVQHAPRNIHALTTLSDSLIHCDLAEARKWMEEALALAPQNPMVMALKGRIFEFEGDKQGAWECVRATIEGGTLDLDTAGIAAAVAPALGKSAEIIPLLEQLVTRPGLDVGERRNLHFTLAHLCDKAKHYDRAFEHAVIANRLKNAWYDHHSHQVDHDALKTVYSQTAIGTLPRSGNRSELPVFIVGMPRSGTSLMEQILSCHSQIHARGETTEIGALVEKIPYYPDGMRNLTTDKLDAMSNAYIQRLIEIAPSAQRVTDKMPGNYLYLGFISQVFPGARIINCRRDPRDVCLSHFMIEFNRGLTYAYSLDTLALACQEYQSLMAHWKAVLPLPILDVRYEDLIADPQTWVGRILEFCGLQWEDACLDFHKSKRQVVTASYDQVRNPLYKSSVARWKHYAQHLEPVSRILGLHDDSYP